MPLFVLFLMVLFGPQTVNSAESVKVGVQSECYIDPSDEELHAQGLMTYDSPEGKRTDLIIFNCEKQYCGAVRVDVGHPTPVLAIERLERVGATSAKGRYVTYKIDAKNRLFELRDEIELTRVYGKPLIGHFKCGLFKIQK